MKLVAIMCVEELSDMARKLLQDVKVSAFSESHLKGYHLNNDDEHDNWFADKHSQDSSQMFFTMCDDRKADEILKAVKECKTRQADGHVHAFQLSIEKYID